MKFDFSKLKKLENIKKFAYVAAGVAILAILFWGLSLDTNPPSDKTSPYDKTEYQKPAEITEPMGEDFSDFINVGNTTLDQAELALQNFGELDRVYNSGSAYNVYVFQGETALDKISLVADYSGNVKAVVRGIPNFRNGDYARRIKELKLENPDLDLYSIGIGIKVHVFLKRGFAFEVVEASGDVLTQIKFIPGTTKETFLEMFKERYSEIPIPEQHGVNPL